MHEEGPISRLGLEEHGGLPGLRHVARARLRAWRGVVLVVGSYLVGCGEENSSALDDADEFFVLAQEALPPLTETGYASDGVPVPTRLPVKLTQDVTLQSCPGAQIRTSDDPKQLIILFDSGYDVQSNPKDTIVRKDCQFHITVSGAINKRFVATLVKYSGSATLKTNSATMKFESEIFWQSKVWQIDDFHADLAKSTRIVQGALITNWELDHPLKFEQTGLGSSECLTTPADSDQLVLNTRLSLQVRPTTDIISTAQISSITASANHPAENEPAVFGLRVDALDCVPAGK